MPGCWRRSGALAGAILIGGVIVALMGRSPLAALDVYFIEPLTQGWALQEIAVKATPLLHHRGRPVLLLPRQHLEHRRGGPVHHRRPRRQHPAAGDAGTEAGGWVIVAALLMGALGGLLYALIPALLRVAFGVSEILTSLMLVYVADLTLDYLVRGPWRDPQGFNFPQTVKFDRDAALPRRRRPPACRRPARPAGGRGRLVRDAAARCSASASGCRARRPRRRASRASTPDRLVIAAFCISGALAGLAGIIEIAGPDRAAQARHLRRATASRPSPSPFSAGCIRSAWCSARSSWP